MKTEDQDRRVTTKDEIATMLDDCEKRESKMSAWESGFIDSIGKQFANSGGLSPKQTDLLEQIWERITS